MNTPLVSAVITTYKRKPEMVVRAAKSILNQTYKNIELFVVDDSPSDYEFRDDVRDALAGIGDERLQYIMHEKNMGACAARNTGITASKGEFLSFLDDDDEWVEEKIEKLMEKMIHPEIGLVYCGHFVINEMNSTITEKKCRQLSGDVYDELFFSNFIGSTSFPLIRRECFEKVGMFDVEILSLQDYEMWMRISKEYKVDYVDLPLIKYYIHLGEQITTNPKKAVQGNERFNMIHKDYLKGHRKADAVRHRSLVVPYVKDKQYVKSFSYLMKAIIKNPLEFTDNLEATTYFLWIMIKGAISR
ncbi:MAG: glycosyltransferase [Eubacteriales bacterium]|nr:glycosyltransferase [Eubacteriales bacterium]